jgi:diguanylate cyclase
MQTISRHLESLKNTFEGDELRGLIARTLRRHPAGVVPDIACLTDLYRQLGAYAADPLTLPNMRIRARLLQQHIAPYLPEAELEAAIEDNARMVAPESPSASDAPATNERTARYRLLQRSESDAWRAIYGTVRDYEKLKHAWMQSLNELAQQRETLEQKLTHTTEQLTRLEVEHEQVRAELERTQRDTKRPRALPRLLPRQASRPSALPKRDAFLRRLEAEIQRAKRSGAPLALGLISVQRLDALSAQYGQAAEAEVLQRYRQELQVSFRVYDVVALYSRDEFAVMLPDTARDGAQRALEKMGKRIGAMHIVHANALVSLPPFAGALVLHQPGEDTHALLGRAQAALDQARQAEHPGVVVA